MLNRFFIITVLLASSFLSLQGQSKPGELFDLLGKELSPAQVEKLINDCRFTGSGLVGAVKAKSSKALVDSLRPFNSSIYTLFIAGEKIRPLSVELIYRHVYEIKTSLNDTAMANYIIRRFDIKPTDTLMEKALKDKYGPYATHPWRPVKGVADVDWKDSIYRYHVEYRYDTALQAVKPTHFRIQHTGSGLDVIQAARTLKRADTIDGKYGPSPQLALFNELYPKIGAPFYNDDARKLQARVLFDGFIGRHLSNGRDNSKDFAAGVLLDSLFTHFDKHFYTLKGAGKFSAVVRNDTLYALNYYSGSPHFAAAVQGLKIKARYADMKYAKPANAKTTALSKEYSIEWQNDRGIKIYLNYKKQEGDTVLTRIEVRLPYLPGDKAPAAAPATAGNKAGDDLKCVSGNCNDGYGKALYSGTTFYYEGMFKAGLPHGPGKIVFNAKAYAQGTFYKGELDGEGMFDWGNGKKYIGGFVKGVPHGKAIYFDGGDYYEGPVEKGALTCNDCWRPKRNGTVKSYVSGHQWLLESVDRQRQEQKKLDDYKNAPTLEEWYNQRHHRQF